MARKTSIDESLAQLKALRANPAAPGATERIRSALASKTNLIAARAAKIVGDAGLKELADDLAKAFARFLDAGAASEGRRRRARRPRGARGVRGGVRGVSQGDCI